MPPKPDVGDVDAVDDVAVLEAAGAADRRGRRAGAGAVADAGNEVQRRRERPPDGQPAQLLGVEYAADRGAADVDDRRGGCHLHGLRQAARLEPDVHLAPRRERHGDILLLGGLEALQLDPDRIQTRREERRHVAAIRVCDKCSCALRSGNRHRRARDGESLRIDHLPRQAPCGFLRGREASDGQRERNKKCTDACVHALSP